MKKLIKIVAVMIVIVAFSGCSSVTKTDEPINTQAAVTEQIPTQDVEKGIVTGRIITDNPADRNGLIIYLGDIFVDSKGSAGGFLDKQKAPNGVVNGENGEFTIRDVPPGQYSLIIYEVVMGGKAYQDETGNVVIIKVEPGKTVDLGDIRFSGF